MKAIDELNQQRDEIEKKLQEKRDLSRSLCDEATKSVKGEILLLQTDLNDLKHRVAVENAKRFEEIITLVGELAMTSMRLRLFHGYDDKFETSHHMSCVQLRTPDADNEYYSDSFRYADNDNNPSEEFMEAVSRSRETLRKHQD